MSAALNYGLKDAPPDVWDKDRWTVLTFLMLHSNIRNRCWPSMRKIAKKLGKSQAYVCSAKRWLVEHQAVDLVPYRMRLDDERMLPRRQHVYQLTGKIFLDGKSYPYLYIAPEQGDPIAAPLPSISDVSRHEVSPRETFTPRHISKPNKESSKPNRKLVNQDSLTESDHSDSLTENLRKVPPLLVQKSTASTPPKPQPVKKAPPQARKKPTPASSTAVHNGAAPGFTTRPPESTDPLWNAIADDFFNGVRNGNSYIARILFGRYEGPKKARKLVFEGLVAREAVRQNLCKDEIDFTHLAAMVPKFKASLPFDEKTGRKIELRDPLKFILRWEGWRNSFVDCAGQDRLTYDPNCPKHCDKGTIYVKDAQGVTQATYCDCRVRILASRKGIRIA